MMPRSHWQCAAILLAGLVIAAVAPATKVHADGQTIQIGWLSQAAKRSLPLTYLDQPPEDEGVQGARLGVADDNTTGHFTSQSFELTERVVAEDGNIGAA